MKFSQVLSSVYDFFRSDRNQVVEAQHDPWSNRYVAADAAICPPVAISMKEVIQAVSTQPPIVSQRYTDLFKEPNPLQSFQEFFISALNSFCLFGATYIHAPRAKSGGVMQMLELPADQMKIVRDAGGVRFRRIDTGDEFTLDEVFYIRDFLGLAFAPISRLEPIWRDIVAVNHAYDWINQSFLNGLNAKSFVSFKGSLTDGKLKEMRERIAAQSHKEQGGFLLFGNEARVTELKGLSPADMDLQNFMQAEVRIAAAVFGAPPFAVGSTADTKYSNHSAETSRFLRSGINPITVRFADAFSRYLQVPVEFDEKALYKGDLLSLVGLMVDLVNAGINSPNEARAILQYAATNLEYMKKPREFTGASREPMPRKPQPNPEDDDNDEIAAQNPKQGLRVVK